MVMPCSRSASRPSTSSAKSMSSPVVPCLRESFVERRELIFEDQLGIVEQPADQRRLAVIDAAAGEEAQQRLLLLARRDSASDRRTAGASSEIALALLLLHRGVFVAVDQAALALGRARGEHLADDLFERCRGRIRSRRSADSSRACGSARAASPPSRRARSFMRSSSTMISAPSRVHDRALLGEIERHDRDVLGHDVLPDVELGPVREREDADRFALADARVVELPELGPLVLRVPGVVLRCGTRRCAPWRGSSPRRGARRRRPRRSRTCRAPASAPRSSSPGCGGSSRNRTD